MKNKITMEMVKLKSQNKKNPNKMSNQIIKKGMKLMKDQKEKNKKKMKIA